MRLALLVVFALVAHCTLQPAFAWAAEAPEVKAAWWVSALDAVLPYVVEALAAVLGAVLIWLSRRLGVKANREQLVEIVDSAVGYGEQLARTKLKEQGSVDRHDLKVRVVEFAAAQAKAQGLGRYVREYLSELVEARLGLVNANKDAHRGDATK